MGLLIPLVVCSLLCLPVVGFAYGQSSVESLQCNEFTSGSQYGIVTTSCDDANSIAEGLLEEGANTGTLGELRQVDDAVVGRYTTFVVNGDNKSIDNYTVWRDGALYQIFDAVVFNDVEYLETSINGPVFNAVFDDVNVSIHNHPGGIIEMTADGSASIKFTIATGIDSTIMNIEDMGDQFTKGVLMESESISSTMMISDGNLEQEGSRNLVVNLTGDSRLIVRSSSADTLAQDELLRALPSKVLAEYWMLARDDGILYDITAYDDLALNPSRSIQVGNWEIPLPEESGKIIAIHTDQSTLDLLGDMSNITSDGIEFADAGSLDALIEAADNNSSSGMYFIEQINKRVDIYVYDPHDSADGISSWIDANLDLDSISLPLALVVLVGAMGAILWIRRSRK